MSDAAKHATAEVTQAEFDLTEDAVQSAEEAVKATMLEDARTACLEDPSLEDAAEYISMGDHGRTLSLGTDSLFVGDEVATAHCVLEELDVPSSTRQLIEETTAMMGRQTDSWEDIEISWSYHPDNGLSAVIELVDAAEPPAG
jgi:hypothetical protein